MTTIQIKNYQLIVLVIAAIVLLFIIFRGCHKTDPAIAESKRQVDSVIAAKKASEAASGKVIDSIFKENNRRSVKIKEDSIIYLKTKQELDIKKIQVASLNKQAQLYILYKDTLEQLKALPILTDHVNDLLFQVDEYEHVIDKLHNSIDSSVGANSLILAKKDYQYSELQGQFDFLADKYSKLDYNYNKKDKKLKLEKTLSRILGGVILILGGAYLSK